MKGDEKNSPNILNFDDYEEDNLSTFVKSQRRLLFITRNLIFRSKNS